MSSNQDEIYSSTNCHEQHHGAEPDAVSMIIRLRTHKFNSLIKDQNSDVLEIGVGPGWNLLGLTASHRVGMDVTSAYAAHLNSRGIEFVSSLADLSGRQFDVVVLSHVLEHLLEPAQMLGTIRTLLKPDGKFVAIVPLEAPTRTVSSKNNDHHLFSWNVQTFNGLLEACGYSVHSCNVRRYGYDRFAAKWASQLHGGFALYKILLAILRMIRPGYEIQAVAGLQR